MAIKLQFPSNPSLTNGAHFAINELIGTDSSVKIRNSVQVRLRNSKKYSIKNLSNLLKCFRYFKELRNCLMHRGHKCDRKLWGAQSAFLPVANEADLGMDFVPEFYEARQGAEVKLSLHGILGFTDVVIRLATTIDAELSATLKGEQDLILKLKELSRTPFKQEKLPNLFVTLGWPSISLTPELLALLKNANIVQ